MKMNYHEKRDTFQKCKKPCKKKKKVVFLKIPFFINPRTEYDASIYEDNTASFPLQRQI